MDWSKVSAALEEASGDGKVFPGAVLLVGRGGEVLFEKAVGFRSLTPSRSEMAADTVFDVASLTKALVTTSLVMQLAAEGKLDVDNRVSRFFQTFGTYGKEQMTIRHLLTHSSGYPDVIPFYRRIQEADRAERAGIMGTRAAAQLVYNEIFRARLENMPGKAAKYSDVGFILLGDVVEVVSGGKALDRLATERLFAPLGLRNSGFIDLAQLKRSGLEAVTERIAPTADCSWRKRVLCGEVYDQNAWAMGGVAGHAGLFSTAADVHRIASELIECWHGRGELFSRDIVRKFWKRDETVPGSTWALGWDTPTRGSSSSGSYFSSSAVGHLAYTGCSLWIEPEKELDVVLLTNRIHPSIDNVKIRDFRPKIHDLVMETVGCAE